MGRNDAIVHNVRFYNPEPRAIHCMALENNKLALSRSDNSIEIWAVEHMPHLQKVIINVSSNTIEGLKWYESRLFSCGLDGCIVEYDCFNESVLNTTPVIGGPAWCLDVHKKSKLIACGTEDGYINIMEITPDSLQHYKFLDKQQGRILCICWEKTGQHLVTGSSDVIRVWNVEKGHAIHKMMTGRSHNDKETIVWSLCITSDFTIISGDSRGYLCFWDGKLGTQIENFKSHEADIFSVILSEDESLVYCAGVDPLIAIYGRLQENTGSRRKWAKGGNRRIHDLDVRSLALSEGRLFSGGVDGCLTLSAFAPRVLVKFPPLLKSPCVKLVPSKRYLMLRYLSHVELWKLGNPTPHQGASDSLIRLSESETLILLLKAREKDVVISSSVSVNGKFIAYSTNTEIRFFKLSVEHNSSLIKLPDESDCGPCRLIEFYQVNKRQFCAVVTKNNEIHIMEVGESGPDVVHTIKPKENELLTDTVSHLVTTADGSFLVAADCSSNVVIWSMSNWSHYCSLPRYKAAITALAVNNRNNCVVVSYSDFKTVEFSIKEKKYTELSKSLGTELKNYIHSPVKNITFDHRRNSSLIVHDDFSICVLNDTEVMNGSESKMPKMNDSVAVEKECEEKVNFNLIKKQKHLVSVDWLDGDEMVIVSVCPLKLAESYPPAFDRKRFIK